jgi:hypothetical protein
LQVECVCGMGKRKKGRKKPPPKKKIPTKVPTVFDCPFCNHEQTVECKLYVAAAEEESASNASDRMHSGGSVHGEKNATEFFSFILLQWEPRASESKDGGGRIGGAEQEPRVVGRRSQVHHLCCSLRVSYYLYGQTELSIFYVAFESVCERGLA